MDTKTHPILIFRLHSSLYGVRAVQVREIIWLPQLTPMEGYPPHVAGVMNLRGGIVPVMDLDLCFGRPPQRYRTTHSVVVVEGGNRLTGVIVSEVLEVADIAEEDMEAPPESGKGTRAFLFMEGEAKVGDAIIMVLDADRLAAPMESAEAAGCPSSCPEATPQEMAVFRERARNLRLKEEGGDLAGLASVAAVGLGGEVFGVEVGLVREFTNVRRLAPLPCCPPHILGAMNLRGDIVTLVDIRDLLGLSTSGPAPGKAVVAPLGEALVGIAVHEVFDVSYLRVSDLASAPSSAADKYVKGAWPYGGRMMAVLDLQRILAEEKLVVNEEV